MQQILSENVMGLQAAANLFPSSSGRPINFSTIWRWVLHGVRAADGQNVRLEAVRLGGRWLTSREAIERFSVTLTQRQQPIAASAATPAAKRRDVSAARKKMAKMGI